MLRKGDECDGGGDVSYSKEKNALDEGRKILDQRPAGRRLMAVSIDHCDQPTNCGNQ